MAQLVGIALIGGLIWFGYRKLKDEMARVGKATRESELKEKRGTALEPDEDGVYRPKE